MLWRAGALVCASCALASAKPPKETSAWTMKPPIRMPIADRPADPWAGVRGDLPATFDDVVTADRRWEVRPQDLACTAARDHCLPALAWLWVSSHALGPVHPAHVVAFTPAGPTTPNGLRWGWIDPAPYTAYRTVPATRRNLAAGAIAVAYPGGFPTDTAAAYMPWTIGTVERVDWDLGFVFFEGDGEPHMLTGTRVAVLSYAPGGKVTIVGGKARDQLAVAPNELILP